MSAKAAKKESDYIKKIFFRLFPYNCPDILLEFIGKLDRQFKVKYA
jgi:hypothetical protein